MRYKELNQVPVYSSLMGVFHTVAAHTNTL